MTNEQRQQVERVCGPNFEESDIPAIWREEGSEEYPLGGMVEPYDIEREGELTDMFGEGGKEEVKEFYGSE